MRKILVTSALVYANGPMHLGHILEQVQTDIWVRFQKLQGNHCLYICGDDAHGTPIMLAAQRAGISPEKLVQQVQVSHLQDAQGFSIEFDNYHTTHSSENRELTEGIYQKLLANQDIVVKNVTQAFDPKAKVFLPDRFVKGICPRCHAPDQYGDNCENCGATYAPSDLLSPISVISGETPIPKDSEHYFFQLDKYTVLLKDWCRTNLPTEIFNKLSEWFTIGLKPWDISRDAPYFGFEIPGVSDKYFYVWLDAPIGYLASLKNLATKTAIDFAEYFKVDSTVELYHFIGKDIIYFHALFWPALLESAGYRKPSAIFTHGYLTINGQKMSKSRGTFILAEDYLKQLDGEYLRYYFASKLTDTIDDIDLNLTDFIQKNNSDLVGKIVNIASRLSGFLHKNFDDGLAAHLDQPDLFGKFRLAAPRIQVAFENRSFSTAMRLIMELADEANRYIDEQKPWALAKLNPSNPKIQVVATMGLNLYRLLIIFLKPVLPRLAVASERFLAIPPLQWNDYQQPLLNHRIAKFTPLLQRIDPKAVERLLRNLDC